MRRQKVAWIISNNMKIAPRKLLLLFTLLPALLIGILHATVQNDGSKDRHITFSRNYVRATPTVLREFDNPGLAQIKVFNDTLYGSNYQDLFRINPTTFALTSIYHSPVDPIIGWYFLDHKLIITGSNEKRIMQQNGKRFDTLFASAHAVNKNAPVGDSSIIFASYDANFANEVHYIEDLSKKTERLIPVDSRRYNDGGFATAGEFIDAGRFVIKVPYNMGQLFILNKSTQMFSKPFTTIDSNLKPPHVIRFSTAGYRIDSKEHPVNSFGFYHNGYCFVASNIYSADDLLHDYDKHFYIIDQYTVDTPRYVSSVRVPKDQLYYGRLIGGLYNNDKLILIYRKKILITQL